MSIILDAIHWHKIKNNLKRKYPLLTDADLLSRNGMEEDLLTMIAYKLGKTTKEMHEIIVNL
jgi:hypothetical protein